ncbi:MAG: hypothetical protein IKN57_04900, partial [Parasporobacterium sp.]|nr:hypothetical protein [Parasporobacterium sp.]
MNKLWAYTKRMLTTVLAAAMVLTSLPAQTVQAGEPDSSEIKVVVNTTNAMITDCSNMSDA